MKLGKREIDALACPPDRHDLLVFDDELRGFALRVTQKGTKVFVFQYRRGNSVRRVRIGPYGDLTPAQARRVAEKLRGQVAAGEDPAAERKTALAAEAEAKRAERLRTEADALTLRVLISQWEGRQLAHCSPRYRAEATRALLAGLPRLLDLPADSIDATMARQAIEAIPRPTGHAGAKSGGKGLPSVPAFKGEAMARRVKAYGSALFGWAQKRGLVPGNPFAGMPLDSREVSRDRVLTDGEIGEVWRAAGRLGWPWGPYFRFLLLTLQREAETAGLCWAELTPDFASWSLPGARTKNRKPHLVALVAPAREILEAAPRFPNSPLVFTTTGATPISGFSAAKLRLDAEIMAERLAAAAGDAEPTPLVPWRLHDFRRTGVSVLARLGVRWEVADKVLNHTSGAIKGVAAVYQRYDFLPEREAALNTWAAHVMKMERKVET